MCTPVFFSSGGGGGVGASVFEAGAPIKFFYRFSQPSLKAELAFFPRTSQGHNALPRPGLEPGSSDSEPSVLTTGLLKACPRYS